MKIYSQIKNVFNLNQCLVLLHFLTLVPSPKAIRLNRFVIRTQLQYWFGLSMTFNCCTIYRSGTFHLKNSLVGGCKVIFQLIDTSAQFFYPHTLFGRNLIFTEGLLWRWLLQKCLVILLFPPVHRYNKIVILKNTTVLWSYSWKALKCSPNKIVHIVALQTILLRRERPKIN